MFGKKKDKGSVKEKTKIKEKYHIPDQNIGLPTTSMNIPNSQQYGPGSGLMGQGATVGSMPVGTNLPRNRSSSSSSSSSDQAKKNNANMMSGVNQFGQPSTLTQPSSMPIGNIQSGYGPTNTTVMPPTGPSSFTGTTGPLGKNLYGETGYVTPSYMPQEPFPGQTVYVEKPSQKISEKTKEKFSKPVM